MNIRSEFVAIGATVGLQERRKGYLGELLG